MEFSYTKTAYGTNRLTIQRQEITNPNTIVALNAFCIWGGADKVDSREMSWEFEESIIFDIINRALTRLD